MTNEELKKKIKEILRKRMTELLGSCHTDEIPLTEEGAEAILFYADEFADAFIAAGIGDVSELRNHRVVAEYSLIPEDGNSYVLPNTPLRVKQLYCGEEVENIVKERDEYKHRALVAERALEKFAENITCEDCPFFSDCDSSEKMEDLIHSSYCFAEYLKQAEKELAEERKDE